jgi:hypothetical protein
VYLSTHATRHIKSENSRMQYLKRNLNMVVQTGFIAHTPSIAALASLLFSCVKANSTITKTNYGIFRQKSCCT